MRKIAFIYRKVYTTQRLIFIYIKQKSLKKHLKKTINAVAFYFRNLEYSQSLQRFILSFLTFIVDLTFVKILNVYLGDGKGQ